MALFSRLARVLGPATISLLVLTLLVALLALATATIGPAIWPIPLLGLLGLVLLPFPTVFAYLLLAWVIYLPAIAAVRLLALRRARMLEGVLALAAIGVCVGLGYQAAHLLNERAGVDAMAAPPPLPPVSVAPGGSIALIGSSMIRDEEPCSNLCLALLVGGEVDTVLVAQTAAMPDPLARLSGFAIRFGARGRDCLRGKSDWTMVPGASPAEQRESFYDGYGGNLSFELVECLDVRPVMIDPASQPTVINWEIADGEKPQEVEPGVWPAQQVQATIMPQARGMTQVSRRSGREGYRYFAPLAIWPYAGNAGLGGYFDPVPALEHFRTIPYEDSRAKGWWPLIAGSDAMLDRTIAYLDEVTIRESFIEWRRRTGRDGSKPGA